MMSAELISSCFSCMVRGSSTGWMTPFLPRMHGRDRATFLSPYSPVSVVLRGMTFFLSCLMTSMMWVSAELMP